MRIRRIRKCVCALVAMPTSLFLSLNSVATTNVLEISAILTILYPQLPETGNTLMRKLALVRRETREKRCPLAALL